jgi:hypothetical protein
MHDFLSLFAAYLGDSNWAVLLSLYIATGHANSVARWYIFVPKIPIWVYIFWRALEWKMLVYFTYCYLVDFTVIRYILFPFVHFVVNRYIFDSFGMLY